LPKLGQGKRARPKSGSKKKDKKNETPKDVIKDFFKLAKNDWVEHESNEIAVRDYY